MNLPIAERELRVAARSPRTYRARLVACVIFGAVTGWSFWFATKVQPFYMIAPQVYAFISYVAMIICMFSATVTVDAIASEKRNGTLGLLFLTDLRAADIVFGKLTALGLLAFYGLVATVPVLAMPLLMGGISGQSVFRTAITLLNALFFSLSLGLWVSAHAWDQKRASNRAVWVIIMLMWILPALSFFVRFRYGWVELADWLFIISPTYQQSHASPFGLGMMFDRYWTSFSITHAMAWFALWRACAHLPHAWQDRAVVPATGWWKKFWQEVRFGSPKVRHRLRARLLQINAIHWLSAREKFAPVNMWLFVAAALVGWAALWAFVTISRTPGGRGPEFWAFGFPVTIILWLGFRVRACALAGEVIARDRLSGALELLLSTTLTEHDVAQGQKLTLLRTLRGPAIALMAIGTILFIFVMREVDRGGGGPDAPSAIIVYFVLMVLFVCDLCASYWTGMWTACFSRNVQSSAGHAILRLLVLPWFLFMLCMTCVAIFELGRNVQPIFGFLGWWMLCMSNNIFWMFHSRRRFYERLRLAAAERYQPKQPHLSWWRKLRLWN